jgi:hypothetical protein
MTPNRIRKPFSMSLNRQYSLSAWYVLRCKQGVGEWVVGAAGEASRGIEESGR